jgi:hypothetical protein
MVDTASKTSVTGAAAAGACQSPSTADDRDSLDNCEAMIVALNTRRMVIIRPADPQHGFYPIGRNWDDIRQLRPGDSVVCRGRIAIVRGVEVYR